MIKNKEKNHCVVLGVSYKTCPIDIRDNLSRALQNSEEALKSLLGLPGVSEAVVLATCNRAEIYVATLYPEMLRDTLLNWWAEFSKQDLSEVAPYCFYLTHIEAVNHLYTVVSSIDSLVLGENQILAQVRGAFLKAQEAGFTGTLLNHLFQTALFVGKQVRENTGIGDGTVSIAHAAVQLIEQEIGRLETTRVGILGLGEMGLLAATALSAAQVSSFSFFNRTFDKAKQFASRFGGEAYELESLSQQIKNLDVLITSVRYNDFILRKKDFELVQKPHLLIVDIASPRNVEPSVGELDDIRLFCVDDLKEIVEKNRSLRKQASERARLFIEEAALDFKEWFYSHRLTPLFLQMQEYHQKIGDFVLDKWKKKVSEEEYARLERFEEELRKKILHIPFESLKMLSVAGMGLESQLLLEKIYSLNSFKHGKDLDD
jgi:glutamyl-tRNA reductase